MPKPTRGSGASHEGILTPDPGRSGARTIKHEQTELPFFEAAGLRIHSGC